MTITTALKRPLLVVGGVGAGTGNGAAAAKLFAKAGYDVALVARGRDSLKKLADEINTHPNSKGQATPFPATSYSHNSFQDIFRSIWSHYPQEQSVFRVGIYNIGYATFKPFLEGTPEELRTSLEVNVEAAWSFSREVVTKLLENKENELFHDEGGTIEGGKGTLIFTGATAALRGNRMTSIMSASKGANRNLSQSLAKEFGPQGVHVAHAIIDGRIQGQYSDTGLDPNSIARAYLNLARQERTAWTWELDLRPATEQW
ncbi:oxidoreductase [Moniliophthora roreri MCA 2997]|uniref:Oxidoreductase n=1 Tax=Moniliophthora roreri (strain MCA 2997) TaxID=1381753 RepID=V2XVH6_MONRO|nr:oxidoreductase [Moniliophthora roreri MCA 2997]